jgi:hypothetical protein
MSARPTLSTIGTYALGVVIVLALLVLPVLLLVGAERVGEKILPWLMLVCVLALAFNIVILVPLALIPPTRPWAGLGFFISSYLFGLTGWFMGLILTLQLWGVFAVVIGLFFLGIGVVPIAMLATLLNGMWVELALLVLAMVLTFGVRMLGAFLTEKASAGPDAATYPQGRERELGKAEDFEDIGDGLGEDSEDEEDEDWEDEEGEDSEDEEDEDWEDEEDEDSEDEDEEDHHLGDEEHGDEDSEERRCGACGQGLIGTEFKCSACGAWVDGNPVFQKLCESDVKIIKSKDLLLATPSLLSFQATPFFQQGITTLTRQLGTPQVENGYAYLSAYIHAKGSISATRKANRAVFLDERIAIEFISNSLAVALFDIERSDSTVGSHPPVRRGSADPRVAAGLRVFALLDHVEDQMGWESSTADMVGYAKEVGRIVLGDSVTLSQSIALLPMLSGYTDLRDVYEKYFLVDEEDFPWGSILPDPERRVLQDWLSRFG